MSTDASSAAERQPPLRATLAVETGSAVDCPVVRDAPNASAIDQTLSCRPGGCRTCHAEVRIVEDGARRSQHVSGEIGPHCICPRIADFDCVFSLESVRDGTLVVSVVVRSRECISEIIDAIRETGASVRLERITRDDVRTDRTVLETTPLTEKQREAVELAVELGYYEQPRQADLGDLADRLDVSRSAVSQRLNTVEWMLIRSLVAE